MQSNTFWWFFKNSCLIQGPKFSLILLWKFYGFTFKSELFWVNSCILYALNFFPLPLLFSLFLPSYMNRCYGTVCQNNSPIFMPICKKSIFWYVCLFWDSSVPFIYFYVSIHCLDYYSFITHLNIRFSLLTLFFFKIISAIWDHLHFSTNFTK